MQVVHLFASFCSLVLLSQPVAAQFNRIVYQTDFSSDPGWSTNNPSNYFWDGDRYSCRQIDASEEYSFIRLEGFDPSAPWQLEFDVRAMSRDWAGDGRLGLYSPEMCDSSPTYVNVNIPRVDQGVTLDGNIRDSAGRTGGFQVTQGELNTWFRVLIECDPQNQAVLFQFRYRDSGFLVLERLVTDVGPFLEIDRLCSTAVCDDYAPGATGVSHFDNIVVRQRAAISLVADGTCPGGGPIRIEWSGATPNGQVALIFARCEGDFLVPPRNPCQGTQLGLCANQIQVAWTGRSDGTGSRILNATAGGGACGSFLQLLDLTTCDTSNVARIE